jgi:hypothetical protein
MKNKGLLILFLVSISIAAVNVALVFLADPLVQLVPIDYRNTVGSWLWYISFCGSGIWILLVVLALRSYGTRGLWLLIGLPFALYWPVILALFALGYIKVAI